MKSCRINENWSGLKIIWKKTRILKIIWKLKFWRLEFSEIRFERNCTFENYLKKLEFWKLNLRIGILEIKFEINWIFEN